MVSVTSDFIGFAQRTTTTSCRRILHQSLTTKTLLLNDEGSFLFAKKNCLAKIGIDGPATMGGELLQARLNIVGKTTSLLTYGLSLSSLAATLCPI